MKNDKISIIVPIYNTENCLDKCIQSIINQTYLNLEIILVNDGSTDSTLTICKKYEKLDNRIKVINVSKNGVSSARNTGIKCATGKYIGFVDSDDYIDNDMFEILYNLLINNNADISMVSYRKILNKKLINKNNYNGEEIVYDKVEALKYLLINIEIENYVWNKLFKKELFENVEFPEGKKFEDISTTVKLFEKSNKFVYKKVDKYNYIKRENSIVNNYSYDGLKDYVYATLDRYNYLLNKYPELEEYNALAFISNMVIIYYKAVVYDIKELYKDFEDNYDLFLKLVEKYKETIFLKIGNYKLVLLSVILWDLDCGKEIIKEIEKQKIKKNNK